MEVIKYPSREEWASLALRPALDVTTLFDTVRTVLDEVRKGGDAAVIRYEEKFDKIDPATFKRLQVSEQELAEALLTPYPKYYRPESELRKYGLLRNSLQWSIYP